MNEDYVSYELAVKLKAAGFDEPCDHYYTNGYANDNPEDISRVVKLNNGSVYNYNKVIGADGEHISAPHIYHAQKWLREKWGIYAYCEPNCLKKWFARAIDLAKNEDLLFDGEMFDNFEEATEYAISAALELIKKGE